MRKENKAKENKNKEKKIYKRKEDGGERASARTDVTHTQKLFDDSHISMVCDCAMPDGDAKLLIEKIGQSGWLKNNRKLLSWYADGGNLKKVLADNYKDFAVKDGGRAVYIDKAHENIDFDGLFNDLDTDTM